jgi:hypothetical protein
MTQALPTLALRSTERPSVRLVVTTFDHGPRHYDGSHQLGWRLLGPPQAGDDCTWLDAVLR